MIGTTFTVTLSTKILTYDSWADVIDYVSLSVARNIKVTRKGKTYYKKVNGEVILDVLTKV